MQIILLSGGSGTRLWPLSNDARSKQFLKLLPVSQRDIRESMVQRVVRQILDSNINATLTVATSPIQQDTILSQLGDKVDIVTEPSRRNTFPAICLAVEYLRKVKNCGRDETVVVMPCDPFTEKGYFEIISKMANCVEENVAELVLMGIKPTYASSKYGYIKTVAAFKDGVSKVKSFIEKPRKEEAEKLIAEGALWNGGVFAFKVGYILDIAEKYIGNKSFEEIKDNYEVFPKISFDYEVAEKAKSVAVIPFSGEWKDLGTWNSLTEELNHRVFGNVITDGTESNTHIINELGIPLMCIGTEDLVIAASPDGILVSEKSKSENIKEYAESLKSRPMYEERRWGQYWVIDYIEFPDGYCALTKRLTLNAGASISYQEHVYRDEEWTFIDGEGEIILDGVRKKVKRGMTINIPKGTRHALRAITSLTFIEVQSGSNLVEEDIVRYPLDW